LINVSEAEYTFKHRKPFVPLRLQQGYNPDGWLGALVGNKLYFDFSQATKYEDSIKRLIKELSNYQNAANGMRMTYYSRLPIKFCRFNFLL
jgi:hypothetical protein